MIVARKPTKVEDAYWCAKCNRPPGTYIDLVNRHCIHKCTDNYCKGTQGRPCRFGFPFAPTPMTYVDSDDRVQYRRNAGDEWIHPHSPCLLLALLGHLHQTLLHGPGAIPYTASYAPRTPQAPLQAGQYLNYVCIRCLLVLLRVCRSRP